MLRYWWVAAALMAGGCKNPDTPLPYPLTITAEGLGAAHIGESFDPALLRGKFPGFELEKLSEIASKNGQTILRLKRHDHPIALIISDSKGTTIHEVVVLSPLVKNSQGVGISDSLGQSEYLSCVQDICRYSDIPSITYRVKPQTHTVREITVQKL